MRSIIYRFSIFAIFLALTTGCEYDGTFYTAQEDAQEQDDSSNSGSGDENNDNQDGTEEDGSQEGGNQGGSENEDIPLVDVNKGQLVVSGMKIDVDNSVEEYNFSGSASPVTVETRADDSFTEASDDYIVTITTNSVDKDPEVVYNSTYGELKALTLPIPLEPGIYTIKVVSPNINNGANWDAPSYSCSKQFTIIKKETTSIKDLTCTMSDVKVSLEVSGDMKELFKDDLSASLSIGENNSLLFTPDETRAGYLKSTEANNTLVLSLNGWYNISAGDEEPEYIEIKDWKKSIPNTAPGQWRKIYIKVLNAHSGNIQFEVTVSTWVNDETIDVDIMTANFAFGGEEIVPDLPDGGDQLYIAWRDGYDFDTRYDISNGDVDVVIDMISATGITGLSVTIDSEILTPGELSSMGLNSVMDLVNPGSCEDGLRALYFPVKDQVEGKKSLVFDITEFMPQLAALGNGDTNFTLTLSDASGSLSKTIKVRVDK